MDSANADLRISRIDTLWSVVQQAHGTAIDVSAAQRQLLERYGGAARRYLLAATRNAEAADDLFQEFAVRFLRGALHGASPARGRFRDFLKGVLYHMAADFHKKARKQAVPLGPDHPEPAAPSLSEHDETFLNSWRDDLLARAWDDLQREERATGRPCYAVLRFRADNPDMPSAMMAANLSSQLGTELSAAAVRQSLHRARERFADFLLEEIGNALDNRTAEAIEEELVELGLLEYCRPALDRRRGDA